MESYFAVGPILSTFIFAAFASLATLYVVTIRQMQLYYSKYKKKNQMANYATLLNKSKDGVMIYKPCKKEDFSTFAFKPEDEHNLEIKLINSSIASIIGASRKKQKNNSEEKS